MTRDKIQIYGTVWCSDCTRSKRFMDKNNIDYNWIDIDEQPQFQKLVRELNGGSMTVPTIVFPDGSSLSEPSDSELIKKLTV